jgi:hypothetical protein
MTMNLILLHCKSKAAHFMATRNQRERERERVKKGPGIRCPSKVGPQ